MSRYLTVDGGTTNTRITLIQNGRLVDTMKFGVGAAKNADNRTLLADTLRGGIDTMLQKHGLTPAEVRRVFASGMLTSESGIYPLPHIMAPAGADQLRQTAVEAVLPDITAIPFCFVRGVKTAGEDLDSADMMRGEETELMGLAPTLSPNSVYVLPGSHSKLITVDAAGRIDRFCTLLSGELLAALAEHTLLKESVDLAHAAPDDAYLQQGFSYCREHGLNKAAFKVRVLKNRFDAAPNEVYSFLLGAVLCGEVEEIWRAHPEKIVIGGKKQLKQALYTLLRQNADCEIVCVDDTVADNAAALGLIRLFGLSED